MWYNGFVHPARFLCASRTMPSRQAVLLAPPISLRLPHNPFGIISFQEQCGEGDHRSSYPILLPDLLPSPLSPLFSSSHVHDRHNRHHVSAFHSTTCPVFPSERSVCGYALPALCPCSLSPFFSMAGPCEPGPGRFLLLFPFTLRLSTVNLIFCLLSNRVFRV